MKTVFDELERIASENKGFGLVVTGRRNSDGVRLFVATIYYDLGARFAEEYESISDAIGATIAVYEEARVRRNSKTKPKED